MQAILGTAFIVAAAVIAYLHWFSSWVVLDVERRAQAPVPAPEPSHAVQQIIALDHHGIAEIIKASQNNTPLLIVCGAAVAICAILAWTAVRVTDNRRYRPPYQERLPRQESRELTVIEPDNPFSKWKK